MSSTDDHQAAAERAVAAWPIEPRRIEPVSVSENIVFRVDGADGQAYVLRLHRPGYHSLEELESEQLWTLALREADVGAPRPLPTRNGAAYTETDVGGERRYAGMLEWVEGETMLSAMERSASPAFVAERYRELGRLMATLHDQATSWPIPTGFARHALDHDGLLGESPFWGRFWESPFFDDEQQRWSARMRTRMQALLGRYGKSERTYSLIHADLHPGNVILDGDRLHIIDFDDSAFGWHLYDLAIALLPYRKDADYDANRDAMVSGYREVRALPDDDLAWLPLFAIIRAFAQVGWFTDRPEHRGASFEAIALAYVLEHAERVVGEVERL